jgi:hypothetical protein
MYSTLTLSISTHKPFSRNVLAVPCLDSHTVVCCISSCSLYSVQSESNIQ